MSKAEKTKQFIIEKTAPIINKKGMNGTSMTDIMEATNLAKGGIYGNFKSKDEICLEVFNYLSQEMANRFDSKMQNKTTAKAKLYALLDVYETWDNASGGCPILNFGTEADDTNPIVNAKVKKAIEGMQKRIADVIQYGMDAGELKPNIDTVSYSIKTFAVLEGGILIRKVSGSNTGMKSIIKAIKEEFEKFII